MKRSKWKSMSLWSSKNINRSTIIRPEMLNKSYKVHNGRMYRNIKITSDHIGHRLGEFFSSKTRARYKK